MTEAMQQAAYQRSFAGTEVSVQKNGETTRELRAELRTELQRRRFVRQITCKISAHE